MMNMSTEVYLSQYCIKHPGVVNTKSILIRRWKQSLKMQYFLLFELHVLKTTVPRCFGKLFAPSTLHPSNIKHFIWDLFLKIYIFSSNELVKAIGLVAECHRHSGKVSKYWDQLTHCCCCFLMRFIDSKSKNNSSLKLNKQFDSSDVSRLPSSLWACLKLLQIF